MRAIYGQVRELENIRDIVKAVIGNIANQTTGPHDKAERIWENLTNEKERRHTKVMGVKEDTLFVRVDSPAWLYQMRIQQRRFLKQIKEEIPGVKSIRFKMGKIK